MNMKTLLLMSAISLGLAACGGGSGGSGHESGGGSSTGGVKPDNPSYEGDKNAVGTPILTPVSSKQRAGHVVSDASDEPKLPVRPRSESDFQFGGAFATYQALQVKNLGVLAIGAIGTDGNPYAAYFIDDAELQGVAKSAPSDHQWTGVNYAYLAAHRQGAFQGPYRGADGTISMNGNQWNAELGRVTLNGTISGTEVSGQATGYFFDENIKGAFAGTDAKFGDNGVGVSFGGFAGNNANVSFSGGWASEAN